MLDRWVFEMLKNVIQPLVGDINKILDRVEDKSLKEAIEQVIKLELRRIYVNAVLYLLVTIVVCITIGVILCG